MNRLLVFTTFLLLLSQTAWGQITGTIYDENHIPLPGASVLLLPDSVFQVTDEEGVFTFSKLSEYPQRILEIRFLAYETKRVNWTSPQHHLKIYLQPQEALLETVVVTDEHAKQEASLANTHFGEELLTENLQGTFAKSIERLPGISAINVGVGVAKPVIRGLSSNRIIVNQQGIKQESHQWGSDHGLEVDQFDVERVEIVKGPASLQYGSDGLGGVINILPGRVPARDSYLASVQGVHKTNNQHWGGSALLSANIKDVFVAARYSQQEFGDYRVPATQFTYNGYALPIYNNTLKNTAGQEQNLRLTAGWKGERSITRVLYGHYTLRTGIFSGAVGIPRSYSLEDDGNTRDLDVPRQEVDHYRLSVHHSAYWGEDHLDLNVGYQKNDRREFSFPEFHNIPSSQIQSNDVLGLGLELETISGDIHYSRHHGEEHHTVYGLNVQHQQNRRRGFEFLLPNFETWRSGAYAITEWQPRTGWTWNAGLRADFATNATDYYRQWIWDSNENIIDSLVAPLTEETYFNWSASVGGSWQADEHWNFKLNLGKSFRVPYPSELVSNGIHHGTFRHEVGTPDLRSEHGYQLDGNVIGEWERFQFEFAAYFNYFDNYIYLGPTFPARFSPLPEAGQIFQYRQDDAIYTGFEGSWQWQLYPRLLLAQSMDFVQSYNITTGLALPFTPQPRLQQRIRYEVERTAGLREWFVELSHQYNFAAEGVYRIDRSERATPAYQLWQVGAGAKIRFASQELQLNVQVQNLFDTAYFNHLSRYRLINVPEQGRNVVLSVKVPVKGSFR